MLESKKHFVSIEGMNWFNFDLRKTLWLLAVILIPLVSVNTQRTPFETGWYNRPFSFLAGAVESSFFSFADGVRQTVRLYVYLVGVKRDNLQLRKDSDLISSQLRLMDELKVENERLAKLLDFKAKSKMEMVAAQVVSHDLFEDHSTLQINKGTFHGLKHGQAVISVEGAVGHIFRPSPFHSHVLLLNDRFSVVDGIVSRSRARGIVEGRGTQGMSLRYVEKSEDVQVGDKIVTSGLDNIFPKGFPVAHVVNVENKSFQVSLRVDLKPVVDPNRVEEVFVLLNAANEDLSNATP